MHASLLAKEPEKNERKEETNSLRKEIPVDLSAGKQGFSKVAGMDNLKKLVIESFINVLKNPLKQHTTEYQFPTFCFTDPQDAEKLFLLNVLRKE